MNNIRYTFAKSRSGEIVPHLLKAGSPQPLHSMFDPKREAQRLISTECADSGFLVFLGLGGGFAPESALELTNAQVVVIDFDKESIEELLTNRDYSKLLSNDRFRLLIDPFDEELKNFFLEHYKPALYGGIKTIPLRGRIEQDRAVFDNAAAVIQEAIEIISGDYSVQAHFGMRWFSNIIRNISKEQLTKNGDWFFAGVKDRINIIAIAAAGPSLDLQMSSLERFKSDGGFIICTDTALGALLHNSIEPDAVVSIDCQHISYYHFIGCNHRLYSRNIPLLLDIASPPLLSAFSPSPVFFSGGHPLAHYVSARWRHFPQLDTSGGNVTYACLSLAENLGAKHITLFGADFCYLKSQTYARGTYINPYFSKKQNRLLTLEAQLSAFLYRSPFLPSQDSVKKDYYETSSLRFYRRKLEEKASMMNARIICEKGNGDPVIFNTGLVPAAIHPVKNEPGNMNKISAAEFLKQYRNDIAALPAADKKNNYFKSLNEKERLTFITILPLAAAVKKRYAVPEFKDLLEDVKSFCIKEIEQVLKI